MELQSNEQNDQGLLKPSNQDNTNQEATPWQLVTDKSGRKGSHYVGKATKITKGTFSSLTDRGDMYQSYYDIQGQRRDVMEPGGCQVNTPQ
ncbi:hypothetical protein KY290_034370 [Solanum tuberosum]|uniref:Uncharacterized protein n=1 Tax=Solanum tuberosum TaxID=4113 RepID=A0ABQ7U313_SOLTU|nr:hypothetical protein KY284_033473 [Solanum tuberosum]KAH0741327.1 hypothetical protein KY290_034370 [Solanum tuberosum]